MDSATLLALHGRLQAALVAVEQPTAAGAGVQLPIDQEGGDSRA